MKKFLFVLLLITFLAACSNDSEPAEETNLPDAEEESAVVFSNLDLQVEANTFTLAGEVRAEDGVFFYRIEQGEEELQAEQAYELSGEGGSWEEFKIVGEIPAAAFDAEGTPILSMYGKSAEGEILHPNFIPIDIGN